MKPHPCPDCGEYPVNHPGEWFSALCDTLMGPMNSAFEGIAAKLAAAVKSDPSHRYFDRLALPFFRALAFLRLGTIKTDVDDYDSGRNRWLWDSAKRRGIMMWQFRVLGRPDGTDFFVACRHGRMIAFEGLPRPYQGRSKSLDWMDNKAVLKKKFMAAGIPMARGRACLTYAQALRTMREVGRGMDGSIILVITKPHIGSRSRHSTVGIRTPEELRAGFEKAQQLSPWVVVEQELQGDLFRILLVCGKVAGIIRREKAHVMGDGVSTIRALAAAENKNPKRHGPTFHELQVDSDIDLDAVPAQGRVVNVNAHISRWYGGSTTDFTDRAHPDNLALFRRIADVLGDPLAGVDFIIGDMERSWHEQKLCGVIECNSLPNIDLHHDVLYGESRDIGGLLFDIAFS